MPQHIDAFTANGVRKAISAVALSAALTAVVLVAPVAAPAQVTSAQISPAPIAADLPAAAVAGLPDAPDAIQSNSPAFFAEFAGSADPHPVTRMAGPYDKYIEPGQPAPALDFHDKFVLGFRDAFSVFSLGAWILNAGYEQLVDGSPNYGHNRVAFAQRFGAAAARDVTEGVFGDSILSPLFREDPRYYRMGPGHSVLKRTVYAATRAIITRTDSGKSTVNAGQILGNLGGSVLTNAYYPQLNRGFTQTAETFGGSVGGSALGFVFDEYLSGVLQFFHLEKRQ